MTGARYSIDLTDAEWRVLEPFLPPPTPGARPRSADMREVVNAILYVDRIGVTWRALPHDFPPWKTVYHYFRAWRLDWTRGRVHDALRHRARAKAGREPSPSAAIIDSRSVKATDSGGHAVTTPANA